MFWTKEAREEEEEMEGGRQGEVKTYFLADRKFNFLS